ncbi:translation machinery-associated protein 16 [Tribolium castaneum]|uniref:Translation machinery-associated protein 16 homolog-like Protein n=1 Tax=Tribolium castaneum TaxID=7070 RepID=D6W9S4_TRICA|nr:PREDICTED: translation machinery-associated protein 16 [Tribolium castaneum]EEZ99432.1 Translation machinery-associated protein 16 homolog-like Protein [Tribolium castaneum]|eukprot:XP_008201164.1 PREDICTED: translation machinery-associated protein 16 [Tribolium castaneum]
MPKAAVISQCKHPNSRKTNALVKQIKKTKAREKIKQNSNIKLNLLGEKILWFRDNLEPDCSSYSPKKALGLVEKYLSRFDEELEQIKLKHSIGNRKNRQHASREDIIKLTMKTEKEEFNTCGLEIPDLLNTQQYRLLKEWNGELRFLPKFKLKRYNRKALENATNNKEPRPPQSQTSCTNDTMDTT